MNDRRLEVALISHYPSSVDATPSSTHRKQSRRQVVQEYLAGFIYSSFSEILCSFLLSLITSHLRFTDKLGITARRVAGRDNGGALCVLNSSVLADVDDAALPFLSCSLNGASFLLTVLVES